MFCNLEAEIARKGISKINIARVLKIKPSTLSQKLHGTSDFKLSEAKMIKDMLGTELTIDQLFSE